MQVLVVTVIKVFDCVSVAFDDPFGAEESVDPDWTSRMDARCTDPDLGSCLRRKKRDSDLRRRRMEAHQKA